MTYFRINRINLKTKPVNFSPGIFIKIFQHCNDKAFLHNLAHISGKTERILSQMYL